ncbi:ATP-binding protein [Luteolibacter arcticus]|uniref:histidine kinase n=1 Tax=Luteolibacter arcticus TaxID=1581411 RepID=A0ABT3GSV2_9BACT|nr:ATP-binding protein [Luteolibacter arcticus]MCW1926544.1 ATP-binding protein [Luteolibacter arcticus]
MPRAKGKENPKDTFRISSALKTIIGRELITDDFVAVFELVKNAFDAHARNVEIRFEGLTTENPKLIIKDDGKGMTGSDIDSKWLFVAYSAKREGIEDDVTGKPKDYRDKINTERTFAGAKGVGRFSCDRLGRYLNLYTRTRASGPYEHLEIDWQDFEEDSETEFVEVKIKRNSPIKIPHELKSGTILEISGLREKWDREQLKKLRDSLRKLINPNQENDAKRFAVTLSAPDEGSADKEESESRDRVNGRIKNFLFEELGVRTTEIHCEVDEDGEKITTTLTDRGTLIYRLVERCPFYHLQNIRVHLFALNRSAKIHFLKVMGVRNVSYGSVFLYKNGFRVHPLGEEGDDGFGIERRKQQGQSRYLGTRDLSGRVEIFGGNNRFKETSSRNSGFIESPEWRELLQFFKEYVLRRLEIYAVDVIKWGNPVKGSDEELLPSDVKAQILEVINKLTNDPDVLDVQYDPHLLDILEERQSASVTTALSNFKRIAEKTGNQKLRREVARTERRVKALATAKEEAETEARQARKEKALSEKQLADERQKNVFLLATTADPELQRLHLEHWIGIAAPELRENVRKLIAVVKSGKADQDQLLKGLTAIQKWVDQLVGASRIATRADFSLQYPTRRMDLARYIFEYLTSDVVEKTDRLKIDVNMNANPFEVMMRPIEATILFDNLISNAEKARARHMRFAIETSGKNLTIDVANDGEKVPKSMLSSMFELGISGRGGSGIGLYTCKEIVTGMGGEISFVGNDPMMGGAQFRIVFYR